MSDARQRIAAEIRRIGPHFNDEVLKATYALYVPLQEKAPKDGVQLHRDLAYGEHERHRLDIYAPKGKVSRAPVVVYFHGGGYIGGARSPVPGLVYDNVAIFFARHGMIGVNATYRLAPQFKWPSGGEDVGRVVAWLADNVAKYGGDPGRIFVMGQSAGATHCATWTFMESVHGAKGPRVAGAMLLSGVYGSLHPDYDKGAPRENQLAYYGEDMSKWSDMTPFNAVKPGHPPVFMVTSEYEPYPFVWPQAAMLSSLVKVDRKMPWFRMMPDNNHVSSALQINSEVDELGTQLLEFIASVR